MSFFETLNDKFFNPFCCRNRALYFACISQLIEKSKEIAVLYETDARDTLILYLQNCTYAIETENIGEEIASGRTPQENASAILRYFRACGWITPQEIGRSGDNIASVSAYCRKLVDAIHKIFDGDANGAITNHIFSMHEILKASFGKDSARAIRPYQNILLPLVENECDLKNELLILKDSIREIMRAVMRMADANSFGQFLMKDELLNRFFNDYFFIKKSGLIPSYISEIDRMLRKLRRSELYGRMVQEYTKLENAGEAQAKEKIDRLFNELDIEAFGVHAFQNTYSLTRCPCLVCINSEHCIRRCASNSPQALNVQLRVFSDFYLERLKTSVYGIYSVFSHNVRFIDANC